MTDKKELEALFRGRAGRIKAYAEKLLCGSASPEDAVSEVFMRVLKNADKFVEASAKADKDKDHGASALGKKVDDLTHGKTDLEKIGSAIDGFASKVEAKKK